MINLLLVLVLTGVAIGGFLIYNDYCESERAAYIELAKLRAKQQRKENK